MEAVKESQELKPSFDPNKKYRWGQEDEFVVSGGEFGLLLNALRAIIATPDAQRILLAEKANEVVENVLTRNVENGLVREAEGETKQSSL